MKHINLLALAAILVLAASCSSTAKLMNTATYQRIDFQPYVTPLQVDLEVSPKKVDYFMIVSKTVAAGGYNNVIATAVKEALDANGGGDVIVGLQTQIKYSETGEFESVNVTGYPARYINFRSNDQLPMRPATVQDETTGGFPFLGKKK